MTVGTAQHAIDCLQDHASRFSDRPFFHYLAFNAPHFPLHALPEDIQRYEDRYLEGWGCIAGKKESARQKKLDLNVGTLSPLETEVGPPYAFPEQIKILGPGEGKPPTTAGINSPRYKNDFRQQKWPSMPP